MTEQRTPTFEEVVAEIDKHGAILRGMSLHIHELAGQIDDLNTIVTELNTWCNGLAALLAPEVPVEEVEAEVIASGD